ncbi:aspartyl-phosphate phosphatase Spo0E family protein [Neobacillus sp. LXY-4]|uniref:aspartyl-phosphate phosphatase Spo0E family protein n=1 Tax=Neobacillus sp. LXY-4 TaxID=3379826 RepID=UPI003EE319B5
MEGLLCSSKHELINKIEYLKNNMVDTAMKMGLNNDKTIKISQELDHLIFQYQSLTR